MHLVPHNQLLELYVCIKKEIKRRKDNSRLSNSFGETLKTFEEMYPDDSIFGIKKNKKFLAIQGATFLQHPRTRIRFIPHILKQDWLGLFSSTDTDRKYYVYAHCDPESKFILLPKEIGGTSRYPFYIGKGTKDRAYNLKRNEGHGVKLRSLITKGFENKDIVKIIKDNLTEVEALELESKLIYFFGTIFEKDKHGILVNLDIPAAPRFSDFIVLPSLYKERKNQRKQKGGSSCDKIT